MNLDVQTPNERLAALDKPKLEIFGQLKLSPQDWLVICAGFEDRALGVFQNAISAGTRFNVLLVLYEPFFEENKVSTIRSTCLQAGIHISEVTYDRQEPSGFGSLFVEALSGSQGRLFVDTSAMSRLLIVQVIVALGTRKSGFRDCFLAYTEPRHYSPTEPEARAELIKSESDPTFSVLFLSSGVFQVTLIPELSSFAPAGAQTRLITFPSLDAHHLTALRSEVQPSRFSLIEGVPPDPQNRWRQEVIAAVNRLDTIQDAERYQTSTLDYRETLDCLLRLYSNHAIRERLLISPTGSKMQTVAVGIFRSFIEDVQIVYPTPRGYCKPDGYTVGTGSLRLLALAPFSAAALTLG